MLALTALLTLSCAAPSAPTGPDLNELYASGVTMEAWVEAVDLRKALWEANWTSAAIPEDVAQRVARLEGDWRLLVVTAAGCTDSAWTVPVLGRLAEMADAVGLRIVDAEVGREVLDTCRTPDGRAATPTVVVFDPAGEEAGCWIERPARQRDFYDERLKNVGRGSEPYLEAAAEYVAWYREDAGASALREIVTILEAAEAGARGCSAGTGSYRWTSRPYPGHRQALHAAWSLAAAASAKR
jgi:hypothetical protein